MPPDDQLQVHDEGHAHLLHDHDGGIPISPLLAPPSDPAPALLPLHVPAINTPSRSKEPFSVLARIPLDVLDFRERVFSLDEPMTFDHATWERFWP
jgi:hypothetical protein